MVYAEGRGMDLYKTRKPMSTFPDSTMGIMEAGSQSTT